MILTGATVKLISKAGESTEQLEAIIDTTISTLNICNCSIPNMTGTAGAKTVTLDSRQYGAVMFIIRTMYINFAKNFSGMASTTLGNISFAYSDLLSNPGNFEIIKQIAYQLRPRSILRTFS